MLPVPSSATAANARTPRDPAVATAPATAPAPSSPSSSSSSPASSEQTFGEPPHPSPVPTPMKPSHGRPIPHIIDTSNSPLVAACAEAHYHRRQVRARHAIWSAMSALHGTTTAALSHSAGHAIVGAAGQSMPSEASPEARQLIEQGGPHLPFALAWPSLDSVHGIRERRDMCIPPPHLLACVGSVIAVAGQIGAGKSTVCVSLEKLFLRAGIPVVVLPEEIPHELLGHFIAHAAAGGSCASPTPNPFAFPLQMWMLERCIRRALRAIDLAKRGVVVIMDRCLHENIAFARLQHKSGNLTDDQWGIYLTHMRASTLTIPPPDLIVLLDVPPELALARCQARARPGEGGYELSYFLALAREYELVFRDCGPTPLVRVDWTADHPVDKDSKCLLGNAAAELARIASAALCAAPSPPEGPAVVAPSPSTDIPAITRTGPGSAPPIASSGSSSANNAGCSLQ